MARDDAELVIFAGPTLSATEIRRSAKADVRGPVKRGDVYVATRARPRVIAIIDGFFDQTPSVWHKEILWAMASGIKVYGSASLGALRAAELRRYGMRGVGEIFRQLVDGALVADDEVAIAHAGAEHGYRAASEALVNIRQTLVAAARESVLDESTAAALASLAQRTWYPDRNYRALLAEARSALGASALAAFEAWLPAGRVDQKQLDAREMLATIEREWDEPAPPIGFAFQRTEAWTTLCAKLDRAVSTLEATRGSPSPTDPISLSAALRAVAVAGAAANRTVLTAGEYNAAIAAFRRERGLLSAEAFDAWANEHFDDDAALKAFFREEVLVRALCASHGALAEQLERHAAIALDAGGPRGPKRD